MSPAARRVRVVGIGAGSPDHLTVEAVRALRGAAFALAARKRADDPLVAARRAIVERHAPGLTIVEVDDPPRDRRPADDRAYDAAVTDWHDARAAAFEQALDEHWGDGGGDAVFLTWGDPAFYDSTIRVVEKVLDRGALTFGWDVVPGISALQALASQHRIVLHDVGRPVHVTTERRLAEAVREGQANIVVMLTSATDLDGLDDWHVWWGANLGTAHQRLVAGPVGGVAHEITRLRAEVKDAAGWVMDVLLLRRIAGESRQPDLV